MAMNLSLNMAALLASLLLLLGFSVGGSLARQQGAEESGWRLPKLFDYGQFRQQFDKSYDSHVEELHRRSLFVPRALKVAASGLVYMHRKQDYHLAINHMSDWTPEELEMLNNKYLRGGVFGGSRAKVASESEEERARMHEQLLEGDEREFATEVSDEELRGALSELEREIPEAAAMLGDGAAAAAAGERRRRSKRSAGAGAAKLALRPLEPSALIGKVRPAGPSKALDIVPSNNPNYEPADLASHGLVSNQMKSVKVSGLSGRWAQKSFLAAFTGVKEELKSELASANQESGRAEPVELADGLVVDHSADACMDYVRDQKKCGSCYAFAAVTMFEWLYCKKFGKLARFSEQYIVDCGRKHIDVKLRLSGLSMASGCDGGNPRGVADFVRNFGLELRARYPYMAENRICPYDDNYADLSTTGYIRFDVDNALKVPYELWEQYLAHSPIEIALRTDGSNFMQYGSGVLKLDCTRWYELHKGGPFALSMHAVVLVGHGKWEGVEYWKIRNSWNTDWGEWGYVRVRKDSKRCFDKHGYMYATKDGLNFETSAMGENSRHNLARVDRAVAWAEGIKLLIR